MCFIKKVLIFSLRYFFWKSHAQCPSMIVPTLQCPTPNSTKHIGARVNNKHVVGRGGGGNTWYCPGDDWQDRDWNRRGQGWFRHWIRDRSGGHGWHLLTRARPGTRWSETCNPGLSSCHIVVTYTLSVTKTVQNINNLEKQIYSWYIFSAHDRAAQRLISLDNWYRNCPTQWFQFKSYISTLSFACLLFYYLLST